MLDEIPVLRAAAERYRDAAIAAGQPWPAPAAPDPNPPLDLARKVFDTDHLPEQLLWIQNLGWHDRHFVNGCSMEPWPTHDSVRTAFDFLVLAAGVPFNWRRQIPLFFHDEIVFMFVLDGDRVGEIWRYEIDVDNFGTAIRAATSLATLFDQWTAGLASGLFSYSPDLGWFSTSGNGGTEEFDLYPGLDVLAFPVYIGQEPWLRERQRACGVDTAAAERDFDEHEQAIDEAEAVYRSLALD
ncbi:hypothetical protein [Glycomyces sp. NPDC048151]|uniref:hypothetical protein n=1 Tax=Glycomyces sp. NPDC048151 TaxID=3364002 RepID=UPI00371F568B